MVSPPCQGCWDTHRQQRSVSRGLSRFPLWVLGPGSQRPPGPGQGEPSDVRGGHSRSTSLPGPLGKTCTTLAAQAGPVFIKEKQTDLRRTCFWVCEDARTPHTSAQAGNGCTSTPRTCCAYELLRSVLHTQPGPQSGTPSPKPRPPDPHCSPRGVPMALPAHLLCQGCTL